MSKKKYSVQMKGSLFLTVEAETTEQAEELAWELLHDEFHKYESDHLWDFCDVNAEEIKE